METRTIYFAGAPFIPGTGIPNNVTGECGHKHKTPEAAQSCIDKSNRSLQRSIGMHYSYIDRRVMRQDQIKVNEKWIVVSGMTKPCSDWE